MFKKINGVKYLGTEGAYDSREEVHRDKLGENDTTWKHMHNKNRHLYMCTTKTLVINCKMASQWEKQNKTN